MLQLAGNDSATTRDVPQTYVRENYASQRLTYSRLLFAR
jgi:hypothetical protein